MKGSYLTQPLVSASNPERAVCAHWSRVPYFAAKFVLWSAHRGWLLAAICFLPICGVAGVSRWANHVEWTRGFRHVFLPLIFVLGLNFGVTGCASTDRLPPVPLSMASKINVDIPDARFYPDTDGQRLAALGLQAYKRALGFAPWHVCRPLLSSDIRGRRRRRLRRWASCRLECAR